MTRTNGKIVQRSDDVPEENSVAQRRGRSGSEGERGGREGGIDHR